MTTKAIRITPQQLQDLVDEGMTTEHRPDGEYVTFESGRRFYVPTVPEQRKPVEP